MEKQIRELSLKNSRRRLLKRILAMLCAVVLFFTMNSLKRNADTLERIPMCGLAEHVHAETCFNELGEQICGCEAHTHTDACYQQRPTEEAVAAMQIDDAIGEVEMTLGEADVLLAQEPAPMPEAAVEGPANAPVVEPESVVFVLNGTATLSEIIAQLQLQISIDEIEIVGMVETDEAQAGAVRVDALDGDYLITAQREFDVAELALVRSSDIVTVQLVYGGLAPVEEQPVTEAPVEEQQSVEAVPQEAISAEEEIVSQSIEEQPVEELPIEEQPVEELPIEEEPVEEEPVEELPIEEEPVEEEPVEELPIEEEPVEEEPVEEEPVEELPIEEEPVEEEPVEELPVEEGPVEEEPVEEEPIEEEPVEEEPVEEEPIEEEPVEEEPVEELPIEEEPVEEEPVEELPIEEEPVEEEPVEELPIEEEPVEEEPVEELPVEEEPAEEEPVEELPIEEEPVEEEPVEEEPVEEEPIDEAPVEEEPVEEEPVEELPVEEEPIDEEPVEEELVEEEPIEEEPIDEEPIEEEPVEEEPVEEEPIEEEPVEEEPVEELSIEEQPVEELQDVELSVEEQPVEDMPEEELSEEKEIEALAEEDALEEALPMEESEEKIENSELVEEQPIEEQLAEEQAEETASEEKAPAEDEGEEEQAEETASEEEAPAEDEGEEEQAEETASEEEAPAEDEGEEEQAEEPASEEEAPAEDEGDKEQAEEITSEEKTSAEDEAEETASEEEAPTEDEGDKEQAEEPASKEKDPAEDEDGEEQTEEPASKEKDPAEDEDGEEQAEEPASKEKDPAEDEDEEEQAEEPASKEKAPAEDEGEEEQAEEPASEEKAPAEDEGEEEQAEEPASEEEPSEDDEEQAMGEGQQAVYTVVIDLSEVEEYPLSLRALMERATVQAEAEEANDDGQPEETAQPEDESQPEETDQQDAAQSEATEAAPSVEFDDSLLRVEEIEGDWTVTPISDFENTQIIVTDGGRYELTLVHCALTPAEPEITWPAQAFEGQTKHVKVSVSAPEGAFPEGTTMTVKDVQDEQTLSDIEQTVGEDFVEVKRVHAVDISFANADGEEIEPLAPISVVMTVAEIEQTQEAVVVHVDDAGEAAIVDSQTETPKGEMEMTVEMPAAEQSVEAGDEVGEEVAFEADSFSVYAIVVTETISTRYISADGETWNISVGYGPEAGIPADAALAVHELEDDECADYLNQTADLLKGRETITLARFFDITILDVEGNKLQPAVPVQVDVALDGANEDAVKAVHFAGDETEVIEASREDGAVRFDAEGFSVYGIVYTVDFYYGVDGKSFEYHIDGGSVQSLRELLPMLGVVAEDEAADFVAGIEAVSFSDETLVKPVAVTEDTTAGAIVDALDIEIEYSASLSEADLETIRTRAFTAPDWALVSIRPFCTEETLTITLVNGEVVTVTVEDAQDPSTYLGKQIIIYDNGEKRAMTADNWGYDGYRTRFNTIPESNADSDVKAHWTIESYNGGYYLKSYDGKYLRIDSDNIGLVDSKNEATLLGIQAGSNPDYRIYDKNNYENVLTYCDNKAYDGFFSAPNGANYYDSENQRWLYIREASGTTNDNGYITVNDWNMGYLKNGTNEFHSNVTDGQIGWNGENKNHQGIVANANPGYAFSHWTVTNTSGYTWNSGLYLESNIAAGTFERAALTDRKERFTAVFKPVHQFTVKVAPGFESFGTYASKYLGTDASGNGIAAYQGQSYSNYGSANASTDDSAFKYGFGTVANEGYEFAFWMYQDQETGLFKGLRSINSGDIIPFNGVTYEAYFTVKGKKLIVYQTSNSAVGSVSKGYGYTDEPGATATVTNDAYVFTGWYDQNGNCVSTNSTFDPALATKSTVLTAEFAERRSGNVTFKVADGGQGTLKIADSETTSQKTVHMNESGDGKLEQKVVAEPNDGSSFVYWELNRNGNILRLSYDSATIDGDSWLTFQDGDTMTAYFSQGTERDFDANQTATSDINISDAKKRELQAWLESLKNSHTASADKTAHVYDYDNRIYQIDITAESSLMDFEADIDLAFIIDVSNSMLFPSKFVKNGDEMILTQDNLNATYPDGSTHYIISDPTGTSTAYRIFRKADGIWYYVDASLTDDVAHKIAWDCRYSETDWNAPYRYPIYNAVGSKRRVDYLNESMQSAIQSLHSILGNFKNAGGTTHDIRVAHSTFAASVYSITPESPFVFNQFQSMKDNETLSISVRDTGGGTRQDLALRDARGFNWDGNHKKYAILITDGAPVVGSKGSIDGKSLDTIRNDIGTEAENLKNQNVTLITVGLSTQNVLFGSNKLKKIASIGEDGKRLFFQAEHADDLENILLDILRMIMQQKTVSGEVTDVIDPAFYPVDQNGNPIAEGMYLNNGTPIGDNDHVGEPRYEWRKQDDRWVITYHNQIFGPDDAWKQSVLVKSKEDFLGGNTIPTNVSASVQPMWYFDDNGQSWHGYTEDAIALPVPHVNVDELSLTQNSTEWTVYLGTEVDPLEELKRLYAQIDVNEVVSRTVNGQHAMMISASDMLYDMLESAQDGRSQKGTAPETFKLSAVAPLSDQDWQSLIGGNEVEKLYGAYTHSNVGRIVYSLTKEVVSGETGLETSPHDTTVVGQNVEQYTLTATYVPAGPTTPEHGWHTTPGKTPGNVTNNMESANGHRIHVFVKGLHITKRNEDYSKLLTGAEFKLVRTPRSGETEGLITVDGRAWMPVADLNVDGSGEAWVERIPALHSGEEYWLIETKAPSGYMAAAPMPVTLTIVNSFDEVPHGNLALTERPADTAYDWIQTASLVLGGTRRHVDENGNEGTVTLTPDSTNGIVYYWIPNNPGVSLPATGGIGTGAFYVLGGLLTLLAAALLLRRKGRKDA